MENEARQTVKVLLQELRAAKREFDRRYQTCRHRLQKAKDEFERKKLLELCYSHMEAFQGVVNQINASLEAVRH